MMVLLGVVVSVVRGEEATKENPVVVVTERRVTVNAINLEGVMVIRVIKIEGR